MVPTVGALSRQWPEVRKPTAKKNFYCYQAFLMKRGRACAGKRHARLWKQLQCVKDRFKKSRYMREGSTKFFRFEKPSPPGGSRSLPRSWGAPHRSCPPFEHQAMTANASLGLPKSKRFPPLCLPPCAFLVLMRQQSLKIAQITASLSALREPRGRPGGLPEMSRSGFGSAANANFSGQAAGEPSASAWLPSPEFRISVGAGRKARSVRAATSSRARPSVVRKAPPKRG